MNDLEKAAETLIGRAPIEKWRKIADVKYRGIQVTLRRHERLQMLVNKK